MLPYLYLFQLHLTVSVHTYEPTFQSKLTSPESLTAKETSGFLEELEDDVEDLDLDFEDFDG